MGTLLAVSLGASQFALASGNGDSAASAESCHCGKKDYSAESHAQEQAKAAQVQVPERETLRVTPDTERTQLQVSTDPTRRMPVEIEAEIVGYGPHVEDVRIDFYNLPIEVEMRQLGISNKWRGALTANQLEILSQAGKTTTYRGALVIEPGDKGPNFQIQKNLDITIQSTGG